MTDYIDLKNVIKTQPQRPLNLYFFFLWEGASPFPPTVGLDICRSHDPTMLECRVVGVELC